MQINITGHQMEVTDALRQRVEEMLDKINNHTDVTIGNAHVVLEVKKQQHLCSILIDIGGESFSAKDDSDNMYQAIDRAVDKICRQMQQSKNRHKDSRRH